jgi:two-component system LytT family sensor kinase
LTTTPLSVPKIKLISSIILLCWMTACALILFYLFNFSWQIALIDSTLSNVLLAVGCVMISTTLGYYQPKNDKILYVLLLTAALSFIIVFLSKLGLNYLMLNENSFIIFLNFSIPFRYLIVFICLSWCALANILWYRLEEQSETQARLLTTQSLAKEAELNSLNSVYALTIVNPSEAGKMITKLASFLRGTLKRDDEVWVTVEDEMEYIQLYLDIEKVRFSHRLSVDVEIADDTLKLKLPGTLLQPIVENAIKFGLYNTSKAITITLSVKVVQNLLVICVTNPYDPEMKATKGTGFGLSSIRRRLYLLFADHNLLQVETQNDNLYITKLNIPQQNDKDYTN